MINHLLILSAMPFSVMAFSQRSASALISSGEFASLNTEKGLSATGDGSLKLEAGGSLKIFAGASLTAKNEITNLGDGFNFIVESDANLLQVNDAAVNAGNLTSKRDIKIGTGREQYNYLGTPVAFKEGQTFRTIYNGITYVLYYNQATNYFSSSTGVNIPGRGLAVKEPTLTAVPAASKITAVYLGVPQNGEILFPVANSNTAPAVTTFGYNLVGNPYASNIDLRKLYDINGGKTDAPQAFSPNISPTFYFWDNNRNTRFQQEGSTYSGEAYALFNVLTGPEGTGLGTKSAIGTKVPAKIVKVGQGFMTRSLLSTYQFKFNNSIRTGDVTATDFLGKNSAAVPVDRYWLRMTVPSGISSSLAVVYYTGGNNSLGMEDSKSRGGSDLLYSMVENEKTAINGRSNFVIEDRIPLGTQHFVAGSFTIELEDREGIFAEGQAIYLKDRQAGTITNLSHGSYTFSANAGALTGRFEILYQPETVLAADAAVAEEISVYRDGGDYVVKARRNKITELEIYDAAGRLIYKSQPNKTMVFLNASLMTGGMYILKINQNGHITGKKILK